MTHPNDYVPKVARNELFYFVARVCMIGASTVGAPIALWLMSRMVSQADALQTSVTAQNVEIKVLSSRVEDRLGNDLRQLSDHELRLRTLERVR